MGRSVGADRIRPNVTGLSRPMNGTMLDVAPFNRVLSKNRGCGRILSAPTVHVLNHLEYGNNHPAISNGYLQHNAKSSGIPIQFG